MKKVTSDSSLSTNSTATATTTTSATNPTFSHQHRRPVIEFSSPQPQKPQQPKLKSNYDFFALKSDLLNICNRVGLMGNKLMNQQQPNASPGIDISPASCDSSIDLYSENGQVSPKNNYISTIVNYFFFITCIADFKLKIDG
jgi:hypothetical protein